MPGQMPKLARGLQSHTAPSSRQWRRRLSGHPRVPTCMQDNTSFALEAALEEMPSFYKERAAANIANYLDSSGRIQLIVEHVPQVTGCDGVG